MPNTRLQPRPGPRGVKKLLKEQRRAVFLSEGKLRRARPGAHRCSSLPHFAIITAQEKELSGDAPPTREVIAPAVHRRSSLPSLRKSAGSQRTREPAHFARAGGGQARGQPRPGPRFEHIPAPKKHRSRNAPQGQAFPHPSGSGQTPGEAGGGGQALVQGCER